jgi:hypothetical protein
MLSYEAIVWLIIGALNVGLSFAAAHWVRRKGYPHLYTPILLLSIFAGFFIVFIFVGMMPQRGLPIGAPRSRAPLPRFVSKRPVPYGSLPVAPSSVS